MKKIFRSFLILCVAISFTTCSSDDDSSNDDIPNDNSNDPTADLVGTWDLVALDYTGTSSTGIEGISIDFSGVAQNIDYTLEFSENPNEFVAGGSYDIELTTSLFGIEETQTVTVNDASSTGNYSINDDMLTTDGDAISIDNGLPMDINIPNDLTIIELTDTTLMLNQESNQIVIQDGVTAEVSLNSQQIYTRL